MKYLVRSIKYFFYFAFIFCLIISALILTGMVEANIGTMFRNGGKSILQILVLFLAVAALYPRFGFTKRTVHIAGEYGEIRNPLVETMENRGYSLESEDEENLTFRLSNKFNALTRMLEDRITMNRCLGGFEIEGPTKDIVRIAGALEYRFRNQDEENQTNI